MPRPRVHPANRLRANEACQLCRTSKRRCSGTYPCPNCIRRGRAETCVPVPRTDGGAPAVPAARHHAYAYQPYPTISSDSRRTPAPAAAGSTLGPQSMEDSPISDLSSLPLSQSQGPSDPPLTAGAQHKTHPRMLWNREGERVYVGKAASLSFLQLLRDTVTQHIGPSQFSHHVKSEDMLESESPHSVPGMVDSRVLMTQKKAFVLAFHAATSGFLRVITETEAWQMLHEPLDDDRDNTRSALRDVMIAIGAQSCESDPATDQAERFFFNRGQRRAFSSMLEAPSLELVRLFLCMSFYMLGACRRNAAFMYLGVAARAAVALGLHQTESYSSLSFLEQQQRVRVWMSLCILDVLVSSILGRPSAVASVEGGPVIPPLPRTDDPLTASYNMCKVLDTIIVRLYNDKEASVDAADLLLTSLRKWSDQLPASLLEPPGEQESPAAQRKIVGSTHVACSYHFAVIVVTRPFLVSALGIRLSRLHQELSTSERAIEMEPPVHDRLSIACVESAIYMIQTCQELHESGLLLGNMCILKAFIFAAALVLGFCMFSQKDPDSAQDTAYNHALDILHLFSQRSAQAAHYHEILTFLSNAITEQRQRLASYNRQSRSGYVSRLFCLNGKSPDTTRSFSPLAPSMPSDNTMQGLRSTPLVLPDIDAVFPGWEGMELPMWDSFPYLAEPFLQDRTNESLQRY